MVRLYILIYVDDELPTMPKWRKDATEFTVGVNHNGVRGYQSSIPKPIMEKLGSPSTITFVIEGKKIIVKAKESEKI